MRKPRCLKSDRSRCLFTVSQTLSFSGFGPSVRAAGASSSSFLARGGTRGLMRAPATQQLSRMPPRMRKLPRQPKALKRYWLKGASVLRNTGLPAMAMPLAMGRFLKKYLPIIVSAGWRLKARPRPEGRTHL